MIKLNLLEDLVEVEAEYFPPEKTSSGKKAAVVVIPVAIATAVIVGYYVRGLYTPEPSAPQLPLQSKGPIPPKPEYKPDVVISQSVEEIVKEIENEQRQKPRVATYKDLNPASKIEFQLAVCKKTLAHVKSITSPDIGFTDLILTTPGDLYIHGMAEGKPAFNSFKDKLTSVPYISAKPGMVKPLETKDLGIEFSLYGHIKLSAPKSKDNRSIKLDELNKNLSSFKEVAKGSGLDFDNLKLKSKSNLGSYKRYIYQASDPNCDYGEFQNFVNKLHLARSNVGILKFSLKATQQGTMAANMDVVLYVK